MTLATYASIRQTTPGVTFTTASGGSLTAGSAWFCVQARNRVGKNLLSTPVQLTWTSGQKIVVTFGATARANGEEIFEYVISACPTNTPEQMKQIAAWRANNTLTIGANSYPSQGLPKSLPATLEFTTDAQLAICPTVANLAALPASGLSYGAMRFVGATSQYVRYDDEATAGLQAATAGYWLVSSQAELETYLPSTVVDGGCDQPLSSIAESEVFYPPPPYSGNGTNSQPIRFWVSNGLSSSGFTMPAGMTIALQLFAAGREVSAGFADRLIVRTIGYVNRATGAFLASPTTDQITWANTPLELPEDLLAGHAVVYELIFNFFQAQLAAVVTNGSKVLISFEIQGLLGRLSPVHAVTGDLILPEGDKLRIVPVLGGIQRLSGVGVIGGYQSPFVEVANTSGLPADSADLKVAISAALGAAISVLESGEPLLSTEGVRAVISTEAGIQTPSNPVSVTTTGANPVISIAATYPSVVRGSYPDVIGGMNAGFNVPQVIVYLQSGSTIYRQPAVTPVTPGQTITIDSLGTVVGSLPTSDPDFGLFGYNSFTATPTNGGSSLPNGTYQVRLAYSYPSPNTAVTKISHAVADGCIGELDQPLQDAINAASEVFAGDVPPISADGTENDVYLEAAANQLKIYRKNTVSWSLEGTVTAPPGLDGVDGIDGKDAFSQTTASFTMPLGNGVVTVAVDDPDWLRVSMIVFVSGAGYFRVEQITPSLQLRNLDYPGNASPSTSISIGSSISPSGLRGVAGSAAYTTLNASFSQPIYSESSPTLSEVSIVVLDSSWMAIGQIIFIEGGGYYEVIAIGGLIDVDIRNLGYPGNATTGTNIPGGNLVTAGGLRGATGATGGSGGGGGDVEADTVTLTGGTAPATIDTGEAALFYSGGILNLVLPDGDATGVSDGSPDFVPIMLAGLQTRWFGASEFVPTATSGAGAVAGIATADPTYPTLLGLEFGDTTAQYADLLIRFPREFDDSIPLTVRPIFYGGGSFNFGSIVWGVAATKADFSFNLDPFNPATTAIMSIDSEYIAGNTTQQLTVFSGGASRVSFLRISRDPTDASDDFPASVYLLGLELIYSTNKPNSSLLF